jgi:antitoxin CptB
VLGRCPVGIGHVGERPARTAGQVVPIHRNIAMDGNGNPDVSDDAELKKLRWRCRRGMRELDQLLQRWLDREHAEASEHERGVFLRLLDSEDDRLWRWFLGYEVPPDAELAELVRRIRQL